MSKRFVCAVLTVLFIACFGLGQAYGDWETYQAQLDKLVQQIKEARDTYKQQIREVDQSIADEMKLLVRGDRVGRRALFDKRTEERKKVTNAYKEVHAALQEQVRQLKADNRGAVSSKKGSKPGQPE